MATLLRISREEGGVEFQVEKPQNLSHEESHRNTSGAVVTSSMRNNWPMRSEPL